MKIPVDTFKKSNPNLLTMDRVSAPNSDGWTDITNPSVPSAVRTAIQTHTDAKPSDSGEKKGFFGRLMGFLGQKFRKDEE